MIYINTKGLIMSEFCWVIYLRCFSRFVAGQLTACARLEKYDISKYRYNGFNNE